MQNADKLTDSLTDTLSFSKRSDWFDLIFHSVSNPFVAPGDFGDVFGINLYHIFLALEFLNNLLDFLNDLFPSFDNGREFQPLRKLLVISCRSFEGEILWRFMLFQGLVKHRLITIEIELFCGLFLLFHFHCHIFLDVLHSHVFVVFVISKRVVDVEGKHF